jgi:predicted transcriptional regulator
MKVREREEARTLRTNGWSIKQIAKTLQVGVASVSAWVSDIELTEEQIRVLEDRQKKSRKYILDRAQRLRAAAAAAHEEYKKQGFERARSDEGFRSLCALYWGEGLKSSRNKYFAISNADPRFLKVVLRWLLASGHGDRITFRVQYYQENGLTEAEIKDWWMKQLVGLEEKHLRRFTKNVVHRASQRKNQGKLPFGTGALQVCSVRLYFQIMGGIDYLAQAGNWLNLKDLDLTSGHPEVRD